jgi:TolB-like protein/Flp pilus assembly protein TadD
MKRCPECRRDYYDETLLYCLEDGVALVQGVVPIPVGETEEPATAILHETNAPGDVATRAQFHTTDHTTVFPSEMKALTKKKGLDRRLLLTPLVLVLIALGAFFGYRYFAAPKQIESIAVMPFVNDSGNADVEYLSDGLTETLIKGLSNLPNLDVKPRSAVFRYKGKDIDIPTIGRELSVQAILSGRVVERGNELTLSLELIDVLKNRLIWAEQYKRKRSELVSLQSEIAKDVSNRLTPKLSGADEARISKASTADPEAYQAYLKGRYYWNRRTAENIKKAIEQFKIATDRDPNYALAFAGLGDCYAVLSEYAGIPNTVTNPQAITYAERAIALDGQLGEPHATLGSTYRQMWLWSAAEKEFKQAIEINPNYPTVYHWYSILLRDMGRSDDSAAMIKRAHQLDPLSSVISSNVSEVHQLMGDHDSSIESSLRIIEIDPTYPGAYEDLAMSYVKKGRFVEAVAAAEKAAELSKRAGVTLGTLGHVYAATGKRTEALTVIKELETKYAAGQAIGQDIASGYAVLGDKDKAFEWFEKDFNNRNGKIGAIRWWIAFETLREDPRYRDLLKRTGLSE